MPKNQIDVAKYDKVSIPRNATAKLLTFVGWIIIIAGVITGLQVGGQKPDLDFGLAFPFWIGGVAAGLLLIGVAEIIIQLIEIKNELSE